MGFENCKYAAEFPFTQPQNTCIVLNATTFIDFGLNVLATGHVDCKADNLDFCCHATFTLFVFNRV